MAVEFKNLGDLVLFRAGAHRAVGSLQAALKDHADDADMSIADIRMILDQTAAMIDEVMDGQEAQWRESSG